MRTLICFFHFYALTLRAMKRTSSDSIAASLHTHPVDICLTVARDFKEQGITQAGAASRLGIGVKAVANQISGKRPFSKKTARLYAETFGYSETYLLHGEGPLYVTQPSARIISDKKAQTVALKAALERALQQNQDLEQRVLVLEKQIARMSGKMRRFSIIPHTLSQGTNRKRKDLGQTAYSILLPEDI